jgi:hypothetical protein
MWTSETVNRFLLSPQSAIIKNIVYELLRECDKLDFVCEKRFVTFVVHLISLRFKDDVNFCEKFDRKTIEELIGICLNIIIGEFLRFCSISIHWVICADLNDTPMNITLKMQVFFIENSKSFEDTINEYHENLGKKTTSLVKEITEGAAKGKEELIVMQKKIIVDVVLQSALGSPSNQEVSFSENVHIQFYKRFNSGVVGNRKRTELGYD